MVYGIDLFERLIRLELHDTDLPTDDVGDVVEPIGATDDAVGETEAFGCGDVTALVFQRAVGHVAAAGEHFEMTLLNDENISFVDVSAANVHHTRPPVSTKSITRSLYHFCLSYLSQSDHS